MSKVKDVPVYLFTGFLEAGKTKFIQETLEDRRFCNGERTLLLVCEEGEEEYAPDQFADKSVFIRVIEEQGQLTAENLSRYLKETKAADNYIPFDYAINIQVVEGAENSYTDKPVLVDGEVLLETLHAFGEFQMVSQEENLVTLDDGSIAITNDAVVNAVIQKVWVDGGKTDGRTDSVKVQLLANGKVLEEYELSAKNNWSVSVTLPKYDAEGREIQYSVTETSKVDGYIASYKGFTVYNTLQSLKPQTGDDSNIALWLTVMAVCAAGLGAVTLICKRSKA